MYTLTDLSGVPRALRTWIVRLAVVVATACSGPEPEPEPPPSPQDVASTPVRQLLLNDGFTEDNIAVSIARRELGLWYIKAVGRRTSTVVPEDGSPPGIEEVPYTVVADASWRTFGKHGSFDLAELARRDDWWGRRPTAKEALAVLDYAVYEGKLIIDGNKPMRWDTETGELELTFSRLDSVDAKESREARVLFPRSGVVEVKEESR